LSFERPASFREALRTLGGIDEETANCVGTGGAGHAGSRADQFAEFSRGGVTIEVHARASANLVYQLDCLAEIIDCSDAFRTLWQSELKASAQDWRLVGEWKSVRQEVRATAFAGASEPEPLNARSSLPVLRFDNETPWNRVRWAEFVSDDASLDAARARFVPGELISKMRALMANFAPRFQRWWTANESTAAAVVPTLEAALAKARTYELLASALRFYGAELEGQRLFVHLMVVPKVKWTRTVGGQLGAHLPVELVAGEALEERVPVMVHELMHHVFESMPLERQTALIDRIVATGDDGPPAWHLFNEVQATAIGMLIAGRNVLSAADYQKMLSKQGSIYANEAVERGAIATAGVFEAALTGGGTADEAFARRYVEALRAGLGARLDTAVVMLNGMAVNLDPEDRARGGELREVVGGWSLWSNSPLGDARFAKRLELYPALSAAVLVRAERVGVLARVAGLIGATPDELTKALGTSGGVIFVAKRTAQAYSYVFVVREAAMYGSLIPGIKTCTRAPGVCHRIP
jgi:hypothetical protein